MPKDGRSRGEQTRRCGDCRRRRAPDCRRRFYSSKVINRALAMYSQGRERGGEGKARRSGGCFIGCRRRRSETVYINAGACKEYRRIGLDAE